MNRSERDYWAKLSVEQKLARVADSLEDFARANDMEAGFLLTTASTVRGLTANFISSLA